MLNKNSWKEGWLSREITRKIGCGNETRFWLDILVGVGSLKQTFNKLFLISVDKEEKVANMGFWRDGG